MGVCVRLIKKNKCSAFFHVQPKYIIERNSAAFLDSSVREHPDTFRCMCANLNITCNSFNMSRMLIGRYIATTLRIPKN